MSSERESTGVVVVDPLGGLLLEPSNELKFKGPFDDYVSVSLTIRNPTEKRIAFKIKTTAPKRYCVKPNSGVLDPSQSMKVTVLLQPFTYDPNEKNKHKFMVQYLYLNESEVSLQVNDILNMWKDVPTSRLLDLKLKCVFDFPESDQSKVNQQQQQQQSQTQALQQSQEKGGDASKSAATSRQTAASNASLSSSSSSKTSTETYTHASDKDDFDSTSTFYKTTPATNLNTNNSNSSAGATVVAASRLDKNDNTLNELKLVRQENESLKKEVARLKEEEARLRKIALQAPSSTANRAQAAAGGGGGDLAAELLNNRSTLIIIILIAIVVYLLLFR